MVEFGQKWLYSGRVVVLRQSGCIRANWLSLDKSGFILKKTVVFVKMWF